MDEVIVRPDAYQESWLSADRGFDWRSGRVTIFGRGVGQAAYVGMDDVAEAVVRLATMPDPPRLVEFGGPESVTQNEVVQAFEEALGTPLRRRSVPRPVMRLGSVALRPIHPGLASVLGMCLALDLRAKAPDDHVLRELGIQPRPVSAYIRELVDASRDGRRGAVRPRGASRSELRRVDVPPSGTTLQRAAARVDCRVPGIRQELPGGGQDSVAPSCQNVDAADQAGQPSPCPPVRASAEGPMRRSHAALGSLVVGLLMVNAPMVSATGLDDTGEPRVRGRRCRRRQPVRLEEHR